MSSLLSNVTFKPLFEVHIHKTTWSQQTFGQNRKHLSPPRMKSNPLSPGQTCDLEPGIWYTYLNFCWAKSGCDKCWSNIITPGVIASGCCESCDCFGCWKVSLYVISGKGIHLCWTGKGWRLKGTSKRPEGDLAPSQGHNQHCSTINPSLLYYFQIIFKWVKSLWGIKTLLNPHPPLHLPTLQWRPCYLVRVGMAGA